MNTLEKKLSDYEKKYPINNDTEMAEVIREILNQEEKLPYEQRDYDLIEEACEIIITLEGEDIKELDKQALIIAKKNMLKITKYHTLISKIYL